MDYNIELLRQRQKEDMENISRRCGNNRDEVEFSYGSLTIVKGFVFRLFLCAFLFATYILISKSKYNANSNKIYSYLDNDINISTEYIKECSGKIKNWYLELD